MGFFEDAFTKASSAFDTAGEKVSHMVDLSKLKIAASKLQSEIEKRFMALGKTTYDSAKTGVNAENMIRENIQGIDALFKKLAEINDKINAHKHMVQCPHCKAYNDASALFCSMCGSKIFTRRAEEPSDEPCEDKGAYQPPSGESCEPPQSHDFDPGNSDDPFGS